MKKIFLFLIKIYQKTLSPDHSFWGKTHHSHGFCKFYPSCSQYSYEAIDKYGTLRGGIKSIKRIFRCNPWNKGGIDPVK